MFRLTIIICVCFLVQLVNAGQIKCATEISSMDSADKNYLKLEQVSIISLIANPEKYHGKRIRTVGVFQLYYDRMSIYALSEHRDLDIVGSSIWAQLPRCMTIEALEEVTEWQGRYIRIDGVFNADHKNFAVGTLRDVELIETYNADSE